MKVIVVQLGLYDFCNAENANRIMESSHKNEIYSIMQNVIEFSKMWMNKSKVGLHSLLRYGLVSVNIEFAKERHLNKVCKIKVEFNF